jgi:hypothetical protein
MGELLFETLKALAISLGIGAVALFVLLVISMFSIRNRVQGRIWLYFVESNNDIIGRLYKPSSDTVPVKNPDGSKTEYLVNPARQFRIMYPPGFPAIVQEPVVAQLHIRGKGEPLALRDERIPATADTTLKAIKTATIMRNLTERAERMAQQGKIRGGNTMLALLMILILVASAASAWISYSVLKMLGG